MELLREYETYTSLQLQITTRMEAGFVDMARAQHAGGRKFHFGTKFLPDKDILAHPNCRVDVHPETKLLTQLPLTTNHPTSLPSTPPSNALRSRKNKTQPVGVGQAVPTAATVPLDPAHLFGSLSPPTLKTCSTHFKAVVALTVELANSKQRIMALISSASKTQGN